MSETAIDALSPKQDEEADIYFQPVIKLTQKVEVKTLEEDEVERLQARAKLWRYVAGETGKSPPEWKERGTGNVRLLEHKEKLTWRLVMRREGTKKVCANHDITQDIDLKPFTLKENSWIYHTAADYSDVMTPSDKPVPETFVIKLGKDDFDKFGKIFKKARKLNMKARGQVADEEEESEEEAEEAAPIPEANGDDAVKKEEGDKPKPE